MENERRKFRVPQAWLDRNKMLDEIEDRHEREKLLAGMVCTLVLGIFIGIILGLM